MLNILKRQKLCAGPLYPEASIPAKLHADAATMRSTLADATYSL